MLTMNVEPKYIKWIRVFKVLMPRVRIEGILLDPK
jgi:hypothetical protein